VLAIFTGPHAYVSATWYAEPNTVPTWNYTAVHVYGICRLVHEKAEIIRMLQDCVNFYEGSMQKPWRFNSETDFAERLAAQVVGFRIEISRWEAKWKLGQNHPSSRRRRAIAALDRQPNNGAHEIAALMRTTLIEEDNPD